MSKRQQLKKIYRKFKKFFIGVPIRINDYDKSLIIEANRLETIFFKFLVKIQLKQTEDYKGRLEEFLLEENSNFTK